MTKRKYCYKKTISEEELAVRLDALYNLSNEEKALRSINHIWDDWDVIDSQAKNRNCLRCDMVFFSVNFGHRICIPCKKKEQLENNYILAEKLERMDALRKEEEENNKELNKTRKRFERLAEIAAEQERGVEQNH